ncbi:MAG TPA: hypothetical protein VGK70_14585 [Thermoanaerobaculia bacterium]
MTLSDWARNGWLLSHRTSPREIGDLLGIVDRDLADSQASGLSADWRLNIAYNAALQAATAALPASGYRASPSQSLGQGDRFIFLDLLGSKNRSVPFSKRRSTPLGSVTTHRSIGSTRS